MGTKTIGVREDAYERLKARKRDDESFTDLVERLLDEATVDWREGFGTLDGDEMKDLERAVDASRAQTSGALAERQQEALEALSTVSGDASDTDENASDTDENASDTDENASDTDENASATDEDVDETA